MEHVLTIARPRLRTHDPYRMATAGLVALLVAIVMLTFRDYGISNDEGVQQRYGELIIAYYASGMRDLSLFHLDNLYLYGGLFDIIATLVAKVVPLDLYELRHLLCALAGVGGIAATGATARLIAGPRAGFIAALMLTLCGAWYGAMFNHTKDIPFAAAMIAATYFLLRIARDLPKPHLRDVVMFGLLMGAALGIRAMGLLLPIYAGLAVLMRVEWRGGFATSGRPGLRRPLDRGARASVSAWLPDHGRGLALVRGECVQSGARDHRLCGFSLSDRHAARRQGVRNGRGAALVRPGLSDDQIAVDASGERRARARASRSCPRGRSRRRHRQRENSALIAFTAAFPVLCNVVGHGPSFTGLRHFLFVVPPLAVLAGVGCDGLLARLGALAPIRRLRRRRGHCGDVDMECGRSGAAASLRESLYNPLVGGLAGAAGRYETDYWVNMLPDGIRGLEAYLATVDRQPRSYLVTVCAERTQFERVAHDRLQWTDDWEQADFFIAPTHMNCDRMLEGNTIVKIERSGILIGVVKDRRAINKSSAHVVSFSSGDASRPCTTAKDISISVFGEHRHRRCRPTAREISPAVPRPA